MPYVFTEQGISMLSSVLDSDVAINVNIQIMRIFARMKRMILENKDLFIRFEKLEKRMLEMDGLQKKMEKEIKSVFEALKVLVFKNSEPRKRIGYKRKNETD